MHKRLWQADDVYRLSFVFGPAPLLGAAAGGALWLAFHPPAPSAGVLPAWAKPTPPATWNTADGKPQDVSPDAPLPPRDGQGFQGFLAGWRAQTRPVKILPTMDVEVQSRAISGYAIHGPTAYMAQITANGPTDTSADPIFVGVGSGKLVVQTAGEYALAAHVERPAGRRANCLERFGFAGRRILSNYDIDMVDDVSKTFRPARFTLHPGLYSLGWVFGCWDGNTESQEGQITIMISRPGDPALHPLGTNEIVFPRMPGQQ